MENKEQNQNFKIDFPRELVLPGNLVLSKEIHAEHKFLYAYISYRCSTRGYIWYKNETLAEQMGKDVSSIKRGLKALTEAKWLHIENRVKKGSLYHQDMRRVIWVYSDYLVALDKGGYGTAKPLPFRRWKQRFINALLDDSKISAVLFFFPTLEHMGELKVNYNAVDHKLYSFIKSDKGWQNNKLTKAQADDKYEEIYNFYTNQHKDIKEEKVKDEFKSIGEFNDLQEHIRTNYIDKTIAVINGKAVTVDVIGMMTLIKEDGSTQQLNADNAMEVWQWLYSNQEHIKPLKDKR